MHRATDALHPFERVAHRAVALLGGFECPAGGLGTGFGVVGHLLHGHREFFHGGGGVGDFLILLAGAGGHLLGGYEDLVGAGRHVVSGLAGTLKYLREVVEHGIQRFGYVAERVIGALGTQR